METLPFILSTSPVQPSVWESSICSNWMSSPLWCCGCCDKQWTCVHVWVSSIGTGGYGLPRDMPVGFRMSCIFAFFSVIQTITGLFIISDKVKTRREGDVVITLHLVWESLLSPQSLPLRHTDIFYLPPLLTLVLSVIIHNGDLFQSPPGFRSEVLSFIHRLLLPSSLFVLSVDSQVHLAQTNQDMFHFLLTSFYSQFNSKIGNISVTSYPLPSP